MIYQRDATKTTPGIDVNLDEGSVKLFGRSSPENSTQFYSPLLDALRTENISTPQLDVEFKLEYFNTSSSKCLYDIFRQLKNIAGTGTAINIHWYYEPMDEDMFEAGEDYSEMVELPFNFVEEEDFV
jgi:hypothetical protein